VRTAGALAFLGALALAANAAAHEFDFGDWKIDFSPQLREVLQRSRTVRMDDALEVDSDGLPPTSPSLLSRTRLRLDVQARYGERWSGQLAYDEELFAGSGQKSVQFQLAEQSRPEPWLRMDNTISDGGSMTWRNRLYRGWVRYATHDLELAVGRQRIALGRAQLWNPSDLFNPIPPLAIEGDERIGVDSVVARARVHGELWGTLIVAPQSRDDEYRSALRVEVSQRSLDAALMLARVNTDTVYGGDFATNLGDAALRGEAVWFLHEHGGHDTQLVGSLDYTFGIGTGLYALVEHFYNTVNVSRQEFAALTRASLEQGRLPELPNVPAAQLITTSRNQTGAMLGYDLTPLLRLNVVWLHDWEGPSEAFFPTLTWSATSALDLQIGVQLFGGRDGEGDYGGQDPVFFFRGDLFF
jgi:hypothetical protein